MIKIKNGSKYFFRFTLNQRIQHICFASMVIVLVLTGLPLKFHASLWAHRLYALLGGIHYAPAVHKIAGSILLILFVYHLIYIFYSVYINQLVPLKQKGGLSVVKVLKLLFSQPLVPNFKDVRDIINLMKYLLFLK